MLVVVTTVWRVFDARKSAFLALFVPVIDLRNYHHLFDGKGEKKRKTAHGKRIEKDKVIRKDLKKDESLDNTNLKIGRVK